MKKKVCAPEQAIQRPISRSKELKIKATKSNKENRGKSYYLYYPTALWHAVSKRSEQGMDLISYQWCRLPAGSHRDAPRWMQSNCVKPVLLRWIPLPATPQLKAPGLHSNIFIPKWTPANIHPRAQLCHWKGAFWLWLASAWIQAASRLLIWQHFFLYWWFVDT